MALNDCEGTDNRTWQDLAVADDALPTGKPSPAIEAYHALFEHQDTVISRQEARVAALEAAIEAMVQAAYQGRYVRSTASKIIDIGREALGK